MTPALCGYFFNPIWGPSDGYVGKSFASLYFCRRWKFSN